MDDAKAHSNNKPPKKASIGSDDMTSEDDVNNRLYLRNLSFSVTEEELRAEFGAFGEITEVHVPVDAMKRGTGFAFLSFANAQQAAAAMSAKDGSVFQGMQNMTSSYMTKCSF